MERNHFSIFGGGSPKEHFCEIILKSGNWPRKRCRSKKLLTDAGRRTNIDHNSSPGELKKGRKPSEEGAFVPKGKI